MNTRSRWSMLAPMCSHMEAVTTFSPVWRAKRPVSMFMPLNWACEAMRSTSSTSCGNLDLDLHPVLVGVDAVGRLHGQLAQPLHDVLALLQVAFRGLDEGDAVRRVLAGLAQAADLAAHLLGHGEARGVVAGAGDRMPEESFSMFLSSGQVVDLQLPVGEHRAHVVIDDHGILPETPSGPPGIHARGAVAVQRTFRLPAPAPGRLSSAPVLSGLPGTPKRRGAEEGCRPGQVVRSYPQSFFDRGELKVEAIFQKFS